LKKPIYAYFDFDDTLLDGDSILFWLRFYYKRRPMMRVFQIANYVGLLLIVFRVIDSHRLKRIFLWPCAFEKQEQLVSLAQAFVMEDLAWRFHRPVLERLWTHYRMGHQVVLISASATFYLGYLRALLPPVQILGTEMIFPQSGFRFPKFVAGNLRGENKIVLLRQLGWVPADMPSFSYSDHNHDIPLLKLARFATCVRPTQKLRQFAQTHGWTVWEWKELLPNWKHKLNKVGLMLLTIEIFPAPKPFAVQADAGSDSATTLRLLPLPGHISTRKPDEVFAHHEAAINAMLAQSSQARSASGDGTQIMPGFAAF